MPELNDHTTRAHALLSASSSERWIQCPASAKLADRYPKQDTVYIREGTLAHEVAEHVANGGNTDLEALRDWYPDVTPEMILHATAYRDYIDSLCKPGTTKMLEVRVDFSDWVPDGFGTADCILLHDDASMDVIDYKYGQGVAVSAIGNTQMQLYGLGALSDYGFVYEVTKVRLHIFQPRKDNISVWETDVEHLLLFGLYAQQRAAAALGSDPGMQAGDHCKFCPHAGHCPELARECIWTATQGDTIAPDPQTLAPEATAKILSMEPMISAWLKKIKEQALDDIMAGHEIPGYKAVEGRQGLRKWKDELQALAALDAAGLDRETTTETKLLSPAALEKALGKKRAAEILPDLIDRAPGSPTIVPASDKRPSISIKNDFTEV